MKKKYTCKLRIGYYAFWKNDFYPYTSYGQITEILPNNKVETREYGKGFGFNPFMVLPPKSGKNLAKELESLSQKHYSELTKVYSLSKSRLKELLPNHPNFKNEKGR